MPAESGGSRSSPFDRMLEENRKQFEALMRGRPSAREPRPAPKPDRVPSGPAAPATPAPPSSPPSSPQSSARPRAAAKAAAAGEPHDETHGQTHGQTYDISGTDIGTRLASRFGENWRFALVDKRRDGEDVVVWARLTAGDHDKTRRGRARLRGQGEATAVPASAGGTTFTLKAEGTAAGDAAAEAAATDEAVRQALAACAKGL